ncbi:MAG: hypothetical protein ACK41T_07230 [Pseudobdellovibrio sp.]
MLDNKNPWYIDIVIATSALCVTTLLSGYYIYKPSQIETRINMIDRSPASIAQSDQQLDFFNGDKIKTPVSFQSSLQLKCSDMVKGHLSQQSISAQHLTFKLVECDLKEVSKIAMVNKTNGYSVQLFKISRSHMSSDFIQLERGENQFEIEISLISGQKKLQSFKITRLE